MDLHSMRSKLPEYAKQTRCLWRESYRLIYIDDDDTIIIIIMSFRNQNTWFLSFSFYIFQMPSTDSNTPHVEIKYTKLFINNEWQQATNGKTFSVINPSTGEEICQVEEGTRVCIQIFILFFFNLTFSWSVFAGRC
jgi:hypothetical protein